MNKLNKYADIISGTILFIVACILFIASFSILQRASSTAIGPQFMPQLVAVIFAVLSLCIVTSGIKKVCNAQSEQGDFPVSVKEMIPVVLTIALMIFYVAAMPLLGFILSTILYLFFQFIILDIHWKAKVYKYVIIAIATSGITYYVFRHLFSLTLPTGILF